MINAYIWGPTSSIISLVSGGNSLQCIEVDERNGIGRIGSYFRAKCFTSELTFSSFLILTCFTSELNLCQPDLSEQKKIQATCFTSKLNLCQPNLSEQSAACPALRYLPPSFDPAAVGFQIHIKPASCHSDILAGGLCNWTYQSCSLSLLL